MTSSILFMMPTSLIRVIEKYLNANNKNPKPFIKTQSADAILEKVKRESALNESTRC